jgi:urease accessory protein
MSFVENQIAVAQKAMPLGQVAAQRVLGGLMGEIAAAHEVALGLPEDAWSSSLPGLAIASARHETQYSRLFRS